MFFKWQSAKYQRFLTEVMDTILALPMVMLMSFTLVSCWHVPWTINLDFSSFNLSMFTDIHALVSLIVFSSSVMQSI